jgi:hypothetical protein
MILNPDECAQQELKEAWAKVKENEIGFGEVCCRWHSWYLQKEKTPGERLRYLWKSLGIPHNAAYAAMAAYQQATGLLTPVSIEKYSSEDLRHQEEKAARENRLSALFEGCGLYYYIKQNCATNEFHFNVTFSALTEAQVKQLAQRIQKRGTR